MPSIDRRIQRTKKRLSESLIALILEKGYEHVTIQDIIDKADVGRSTFYSHYENKEQLLMEGHRNLGVSLASDIGSPKGKPGRAELTFLPLFLHAGENLSLAKAMLGKMSGDAFAANLENHLAGIIRDHHGRRFGKSRRERLWLRYHAAAAAALVMGFLVSWLEDDCAFAALEMAERCDRAVSRLFDGFT